MPAIILYLENLKFAFHSEKLEHVYLFVTIINKLRARVGLLKITIQAYYVYSPAWLKSLDHRAFSIDICLLSSIM